MKHEPWAQDLRKLGFELDADRLDSLAGYEEALRERAIPRGFVSGGDLDRLWERHIRDSLRALPELPSKGRIADLGSGAGLPGLPLAIAAPSCSFSLIEVRRGRAAFLESVVDGLGLRNVDVFLAKTTSIPGRFDVCLARAFASPVGSWTAASPMLEDAGSLIYWAGTGFKADELVGSVPSWRVSIPSGLADSGPLVIMGRQ